MNLVAYSDSESDHDKQPAKLGTKRKRSASDQTPPARPPLPAAFHDLYSANARISTSDDPSLHGGRKRAVPHVEGNWPSHVYLEWVPSQSESQSLHSLIKHVQQSIERENNTRHKPLAVPDITTSLLSPLGAALPLHVSLSRTLQIKTDVRHAFVESLASSLRNAAVRPFTAQFTRLKWVPNFDQTRWFLVLGLQKPTHDEFNRLLNACNEAAHRCGHSGLYQGGKGDGPMEDCSSRSSAEKTRAQEGSNICDGHPRCVDNTDRFHISIAWNLVQPDPAWIALVTNIDVTSVVGPIEIAFDVVKAKVGNTINNIALGARKSGGATKAGLLGLG